MALLETFRQTYLHAASTQDASEYMSTSDIWLQLTDAAGRNMSFTSEYLDNWLTEAGYATVMLEMKRFWLFRHD